MLGCNLPRRLGFDLQRRLGFDLCGSLGLTSLCLSLSLHVCSALSLMGVTTSSLSSIELGAERAHPQGFAVALVGLAATFSPGTEPAEPEFAA